MLNLDDLKHIVERSELFAGKHVRLTVIANPVAGGFTIKKRIDENIAMMKRSLESVIDRPVVTKSCSVVLHLTNSAGHAKNLARSVLEIAASDTSPSTMYLIVTAGGDGTSLEVQCELAVKILEENNGELGDRVCILRLPFGTGNDGSDGRRLDESLRLLTQKSHIEKQSAVLVYSKNKSDNVSYSFNIASIGIDAFVTHMTNRVKNVFPGDFYKLWVDLACVFYNRIYRVGEMSVVATDSDGTVVKRHADRMILYLMGASGKRTYGSNQKILPDSRNVCGIREMSLMNKLAMKKHFKNGTHAPFPVTEMYSAAKLEISYSEKILIQLDGEGRLLDADDFPLVMELSKPFISVIKPN